MKKMPALELPASESAVSGLADLDFASIEKIVERRAAEAKEAKQLAAERDQLRSQLIKVENRLSEILGTNNSAPGTIPGVTRLPHRADGHKIKTRDAVKQVLRREGPLGLMDLTKAVMTMPIETKADTIKKFKNVVDQTLRVLRAEGEVERNDGLYALTKKGKAA